MTEIFNHLHHVCIVVHDIDRAQAYYESIGIGPWVPYRSVGRMGDPDDRTRGAYIKNPTGHSWRARWGGKG